MNDIIKTVPGVKSSAKIAVRLSKTFGDGYALNICINLYENTLCVRTYAYMYKDKRRVCRLGPMRTCISRGEKSCMIYTRTYRTISQTQRSRRARVWEAAEI